MALKTGNIYTYDKMYLMSPTNALPEGFSFDDYAEGDTADLSTFVVLGNSVTELNESPNAETSESGYITNKSMSTTVDSYNFNFGGSSEMIMSDVATKAMHDVAYHAKTGDEAQFTLLVVDAYNEPVAGTFTARLFRVSCAVSEFTGTATEKITFDFELSAVKDPVIGLYAQATKTFTVDKTQTPA